MHQHPPHAPRSPNKLSKSAQRLGVNGWNFSEDLLVPFRVMLMWPKPPNENSAPKICN
jgi:hypothetical protein